MNKRQIERYKKLIKAVEETPSKEFNMDYFKATFHDCKTVGCAVGSYCIKHPNVALKLKLKYDYGHQKIYNVTYKDFRDYWAVAKYFGLNYDDTVFLFDPSYYEPFQINLSKRTVLKRLKNFIKNKEHEGNVRLD